jgi:hypothetical protein
MSAVGLVLRDKRINNIVSEDSADRAGLLVDNNNR